VEDRGRGSQRPGTALSCAGGAVPAPPLPTGAFASPRFGPDDSVGRVSSYKVTVGSTTVRVKKFRDARSAVIDAITKLLAQDPDSVAGGAMMANQAFESGAVEHSLAAHGKWDATVTFHGEPIAVAIKKHWW
jgi:hypothetical protein